MSHFFNKGKYIELQKIDAIYAPNNGANKNTQKLANLVVSFNQNASNNSNPTPIAGFKQP